MTCQEFDQIVSELASARLTKFINDPVHENGLAHAAVCQPCAARLANMRILVGGLKTLASTTETNQASVQTEAILLAAFRRQQEATASSGQSKLVGHPTKTAWLSLFPAWAYAAAAAVLIGTIGYSASTWMSAKSAPKEFVATATPTVKSYSIPEVIAPVKQNENPTITHVKSRVPKKPVDDGSFVQASMGEITPLYREEVATDFLPLTHDSDAQPMESGQVIRVQVPRTALASFGLPINIERANEPVKADLLLAEDGSARAIRFIR